MHNYWLNQLSNRESVLTINKCFSEVMIYDGEFKVYIYDIKDNHQLQPVDLVFFSTHAPAPVSPPPRSHFNLLM